MILVGFIIRIYHDALSPERQKRKEKSSLCSIKQIVVKLHDVGKYLLLMPRIIEEFINISKTKTFLIFKEVLCARASRVLRWCK